MQTTHRSPIPITLIAKRKAMTLMEILIVASLISVISIAVYNALSNGLKIWNKHKSLVIEEDILIFFDKLTHDARNSFIYSKILYEGTEFSFACPTMVSVKADPQSGLDAEEYVTQIGKVDYYFDLTDRSIYLKKANYGQAVKGEYQDPQRLVTSVDDVRFKYIYLTDEGELTQPNIADIIPAAIEVEVQFTDRFGKRSLTKIIDIPVGT